MSDTNDRLPADSGGSDAPKLEYAAVANEVDVARIFVRHLIEAATAMVDSREWSSEDLVEIIKFANGEGAAPQAVLDGQHFRRRLEEAAERAARYGEKFAVMVVHLKAQERSQLLYDSVLDGLVERLRRTDQIFLFKQRFGIFLPYTTAVDLAAMCERIRALIKAVVEEDVELAIEHVAFPEEIQNVEEMNRWVEVQLI